MIFNPARPVRCSTSGCNSSHTSTSGSGNRTATSLLPSTSNFFVDFFVLLWYLSAIAALLSEMRVLTPDSIRVRAESRYFLFQVSTKDGTRLMHNQSDGSAYANRPEIVILRLVQLVEMQARMSRIHLKVKSCSLDGLLLFAIQFGEAVGECVCDSEVHYCSGQK